MSTNGYTGGTAASRSFTPEVISLAALHGRDMLSVSQPDCSTCFQGLYRWRQQAAIWAVRAARPEPLFICWLLLTKGQ